MQISPSNSSQYPEPVMQAVRQNMGLAKDNTSRDAFIMSLPKKEVFASVCEWKGLLGDYPFVIMTWVQDIFNVTLE